MCIIIGEEVNVASTMIFARLDRSRQYLVYSMQFAAAGEAAMILPVPVRQGSGEDAVVFISLKGCPEFFDDLASAFAPREVLFESLGIGGGLAGGILEVHEVGDFEASYVPRMADFVRLDERFRLPDQLWRHLPGYRDWGFAIFQLKPAAKEHSDWLPSVRIHPMAFSFPTREPHSLHFPTVHIHERSWHDSAGFDHELYCQFDDVPEDHTEESAGALGLSMRGDYEGIVAPEERGYRLTIEGWHRNQDVWFGRNVMLPVAA